MKRILDCVDEFSRVYHETQTCQKQFAPSVREVFSHFSLLYFEIGDWLCFIAGLPRARKLICIKDHAKKLMTFGLEHNWSHLDFVLFNKKLMDFQVISLNITLEFKLYSERKWMKSYLWLPWGLWTKGEITCFRSFRIPWTFRSFDLTDRK